MNIQDQYNEEIINKDALMLYDTINDKLIIKRNDKMLSNYKLKKLCKEVFNIEFNKIKVLKEKAFKEYIVKEIKENGQELPNTLETQRLYKVK